MKKVLMIAAALCLFASTAHAEEIDTTQSVISWKGSKATGDSHTGQISLKSSALKLSGGSIAGGKIVFDMSSITVTDLQGKWAAKFLGHMKSPDFFDVQKHPTATVVLKSVNNGTVQADLTIKGVTKAISFPIQKKGKKHAGKVTFDRTKFGIKYGSGNFFENLGDKMINDEVEIAFSLVLKG